MKMHIHFLWKTNFWLHNLQENGLFVTKSLKKENLYLITFINHYVENSITAKATSH